MDRVLNNRSGVHARTCSIVFAAANVVMANKSRFQMTAIRSNAKRPNFWGRQHPDAPERGCPAQLEHAS